MIKNITQTICERLSGNSSNSEIFQQSKPEEALKSNVHLMAIFRKKMWYIGV